MTDMHTDTKPAEMPLLGRCKDCDFALFVASADDAVKAADLNAVKGDGRAYRTDRGFLARCPNRHKVFVLRRIKGTFSEDHNCDSRCLNAKGHSCTCSCGGLNHGRGHAIQTFTTASTVPVDLPEPATDKQAGFILTLLAERDVPARDDASPDERREAAIALLDSGQMTKAAATRTIEWLLSLPRLTQAG